MNPVSFARILGITVLVGCLSTPMLAADPPEFPADGVMPFLTAAGPVGPSYLGIGVAEISAERAKELKLSEVQGVEVSTVTEESPAAKAGFQVGDVVLDYNGQKVVGTQQFVRLVRETPAGRTVHIVIHRAGKTQTLTAIMGTYGEFGRGLTITMKQHQRDLQRQEKDLQREMARLKDLEIRIPDVPSAFMYWRTAILGVEAEGIDAQLAEYFGVKEGVLVRSVVKDSPAAKAGIKAGDVITKVSGTAVVDPRDVTAAIRKASPQTTLPLTLMRERKEMTVSVTVDRDKAISPAPRRPYRAIGNSRFRSSAL